MKQSDIEVLREFLSLPLESADKVFEKFQTQEGAELFTGKLPGQRFLFKRGTRSDRITLIAHADTVFITNPPIKQEIVSVINNGEEWFVGKDSRVGIGGDCRAGCAILWLLANSGHNILLTDGEEASERGMAIGAQFLIKEHPEIYKEINDSNFLLEFDTDRGNIFDFSAADGTKEFKKFIAKNTGLSFESPSYPTDITFLSNARVGGKVCCVSVSTGVYEMHSPKERVNTKEWQDILNMSRTFVQKEMPRFELPQKKDRTLLWGFDGSQAKM